MGDNMRFLHGFSGTPLDDAFAKTYRANDPEQQANMKESDRFDLFLNRVNAKMLDPAFMLYSRKMISDPNDPPNDEYEALAQLLMDAITQVATFKSIDANQLFRDKGLQFQSPIGEYYLTFTDKLDSLPQASQTPEQQEQVAVDTAKKEQEAASPPPAPVVPQSEGLSGVEIFATVFGCVSLGFLTYAIASKMKNK